MSVRNRAAFLLAFAVSFAALAGCGGGKTAAKGKVTLNGKPVVWGSVTLVDSHGQYYSGPIDLNGNYAVEGVPAGPVKIGLFSPKPQDDTPLKTGKTVAALKEGKTTEPEDPRAKFKSAPPPEQPKPPPGAWFPIPDKYNDPQSSGLSGEVKSGQPLDIELK